MANPSIERTRPGKAGLASHVNLPLLHSYSEPVLSTEYC